MFLMERDILEVEFMEFQSIEIQTEKMVITIISK